MRAASPNPGVGCVLLVDGKVVGEGATQPPGGPHAEAVALAAAGPAARGATAVVTLEPCVHQGRTPPCARALADAGVARVVYLHPDLNPQAAGGGRWLREAGVEVVGPAPGDDPLRKAVAGQLEGVLSGIVSGRPHLTLKLAQTRDGALTVAAGDGERWITGPVARRGVHRWRRERDAVLVGSGTVLADDPGLDVRHLDAPQQPRAVVLDARIRTPASARVVRPGTVVVSTPAGVDAAPAHAAELQARGVRIVPVAAGSRGVVLSDALASLHRVGITSVLAEPGPTLAQALLDARLVDRLVLHVAVTRGVATPRAAVRIPASTTWRTERRGGAGQDVVLQLIAPPA